MSGNDTKERILAAAEQLIADRGFAATSLRTVTAAAGVNLAAVHYHFGTKEALIETLLTRRIAEINRRRRTMVSALEAEGRLDDRHALVTAIAMPLAEKVQTTPEGTHYVRFLAHLFADRPRRDTLIARGSEAALLRRLYKALRALTPDIPELIWNERLRLVVGGIIYALADRERMRAAGDPAWNALPEAAFVGNLIDTGVAILNAPISPATARGADAADKTRAKEEADVADR